MNQLNSVTSNRITFIFVNFFQIYSLNVFESLTRMIQATKNASNNFWNAMKIETMIKNVQHVYAKISKIRVQTLIPIRMLKICFAFWVIETYLDTDVFSYISKSYCFFLKYKNMLLP